MRAKIDQLAPARRKCSDPRRVGCTNDARVGPSGKRYSWCVDCNQSRDHANDSRGDRAVASTCEHCGRTYTNRTPRCPRCLLDESGELLVGVTWADMREALLFGLCVYCEAEATTLDHLRPRAKGGMDNEENLVPSCSTCNNGRGGKHRRLLTEWDSVRVAHGRKSSPKVEAEWQRLQTEIHEMGEAS